MRSLALLVLFMALSCSSAAAPSAVDATSSDASEETGATETSAGETADPSAEHEAAADARNPAAQCPGCEVTKCRDQLMACGGNSTCVGWLVCMNDCLRKPGAAACQAQCTSDTPTKEGAALTECKRARCVAECTPLD